MESVIQSIGKMEAQTPQGGAGAGQAGAGTGAPTGGPAPSGDQDEQKSSGSGKGFMSRMASGAGQMFDSVYQVAVC